MTRLILAVALLSVAANTAIAQQAAPTPEQRVNMLKSWLQGSQAQLRTYEWIETTTVSHKGEVKSRKQAQAYYGADGKLQKVPIEDGSSAQSKAPRGPLRKHMAEQAKEDMTDYMQQAVALVHSYIPPDPARIQASYNAGKFSMSMPEPGRRNRLEFHDYLKPGDVLGIDIEPSTNRLMGMQVSSYLDDQQDAVTLNVTMGLLGDGTIYTQSSTLDAKAKDLSVLIENSGYRKLAN